MTRIYGFGNALIDIEITVSEEELVSLGIKKGSMVHINASQKNIWLKQFHKSIVSKQPGGSIANSIYAASTEGGLCSFSCSLGEDKQGKDFIDGFDLKKTKVFSKKDLAAAKIIRTKSQEARLGSRRHAQHESATHSLAAHAARLHGHSTERKRKKKKKKKKGRSRHHLHHHHHSNK